MLCPQGETCICGPDLKPCKFKKVISPNFRPQIEQTAIFVRRVGHQTVLIPNLGYQATAETHSQAFKLSPQGINIEPSISTAPSGAKSYCAWLNDSTPGHKNLFDSNRGRQILISVYTKDPANLDDPDQWSAPEGLLAAPDDFPGLLEPKVILNGDDSGLLVFTALDKGATLRDSGLGSGRYLYAARLQGGLFGEPFRVHGKCFKREYGYEQSFGFDIPDLVDPFAKFKKPEWVMSYQGLGDLGSRAASGNVLVTTLAEGSETWSPPVNLTPDGNIHSNLSAAVGLKGVHSIHLQGGPASFNPAGGGSSVADGKQFVVLDSPLAPDPAIAGCRLDFPYATPGSIVKAMVVVENRGLVGTPVGKTDGVSQVSLRMVLVDEAGRETLAAEKSVPEILPGGSERVTLEVEVPLDPATLRVVLVPGPKDQDLTNNVKDCFLGSPMPRNLTCTPIPFTLTGPEGEDVDSLAVELRWSDPVVYDEVLVYRDEILIAGLPGISKIWIDQGTNSGEHAYSVRGRISVSRSQKATCAVRVVPPRREGFKRGDLNDDGSQDISDAVYLLSYLYTGGPAPKCLDASHLNGDAGVDISDVVYLLSYLYTGGPAPPYLGYPGCEEFPTCEGKSKFCP